VDEDLVGEAAKVDAQAGRQAHRHADAGNVWQAADHVYTALTSPDSTLPPAAFKSIPGSETTGALTRTTDQKVIRANRHAARKACMKYDENYKTNRNNKADPLQYDEFPFASTNEGAGVRW